MCNYDCGDCCNLNEDGSLTVTCQLDILDHVNLVRDSVRINKAFLLAFGFGKTQSLDCCGECVVTFTHSACMGLQIMEPEDAVEMTPRQLADRITDMIVRNSIDHVQLWRLY